MGEWIYNKHALITGASDGIGRELAINFIDKCRKLTLIARTSEKLETICNKLSAASSKTVIDSYCMDILNTKKMRELINRIYETDKDRVDIFINCAGGSHVIELFEKMTYSDIKSIFNTNATAPIFWLRELLPRMKYNPLEKYELKRGHIVLMSSRSGERPLPRLSVYGAAKGAIEKLVEALQREYAQYRLVFTLVSPGSINTSFTAKWPQKDKEAHNLESITVGEAVLPILQALNSRYATNKISYESTLQWCNELGVLTKKHKG